MGITSTKLVLKNPANLAKSVQGDFLVDSGAHYTVVPKRMVTKLNLKASYVQEFSLADGKIIRRSIGSAFVSLEGKEFAVPVVLGEQNDSALLGVTTLEAFGLMLDPFKRTLYHSKLMLA